jgi:hypothetical protein
MNRNMKEYLRKFKTFEDISGMFRNIGKIWKNLGTATMY